MTDALQGPFRRAPDAIETVLDRELIVLDPATGEMFSLNESGRCVWRALPTGSVDEAAAALAGEFDIAPEAARRDAESLLRELVAQGLVLAGAEPDG